MLTVMRRSERLCETIERFTRDVLAPRDRILKHQLEGEYMRVIAQGMVLTAEAEGDVPLLRFELLARIDGGTVAADLNLIALSGFDYGGKFDGARPIKQEYWLTCSRR
jgi:hypothetical protein